jgi:hypothetical protein
LSHKSTQLTSRRQRSSQTRDDPEQSKAFIEKAKKIGADEKAFGCGQADGAAGEDEARATYQKGKSLEKVNPVTHNNLMAIGVWMSVEGRKPIQPVRVVVTYEALTLIDPTNVRDLPAALESFNRFRSRIEAAASHKSGSDSTQTNTKECLPSD